MPTTHRANTIHQKALELLRRHPNGLRYSELVRLLHETFPTIPQKAIRLSIFNLDALFPEAVSKPARGLFKATAFREEEQVTPPEISLKEERFYKPFADWITKELEECTKAVPLGGSHFKDKWGTPDVIGIREPKKSDIIKPPTEIVSAEIKIGKTDLIIAFGQACAYKLFSHRSYIVVPVKSQEEDIARLDVLCRTLGVGLILFDATNPETPNFEIRVRAAKHEPDMFYVNKYMKLVEEKLFS